MHDVAIGEGKIRAQTYRSSCRTLAEGIGQTAEDLGILDGAYTMTFRRPITACGFRRAQEMVTDAMLDYIKRAQHLSSPPAEIFYYRHRSVCQAARISTRFSGVIPVFTESGWPDAPEEIDKVCRMLQKAVSRKKQRLEQKGETAPKILLLSNTYSIASEQMYRNCAPQIEGLDYFHSVFIVWRQLGGFILHSQNEAWSVAAGLTPPNAAPQPTA